MIRDAAHFYAIAAHEWQKASEGECCAHVARYYADTAEAVLALASAPVVAL